MSVCIPCRLYLPKRDEGGNCATCKGEVTPTPYKWSPPKHKNVRAWKRIANGEWLWDRRRVRRGYRTRGPRSDTRIVYQYETVYVDYEYLGGTVKARIKRRRRIEGSGREVTDYRKKPVVDLGG